MRNNPLRIGIPVLLGLCLAGCATTPPAAFYTLAPLPGAAKSGSVATKQAPAIGIGPVSFPAFLDRAQLVVRSGSSALSLDELHRWGGSLQDDFPRVLGENLAYLLSTNRILLSTSEVRYPVDYRVTVDVLRFEGTDRGEAELKVRWAVLDPYTEEILSVRDGFYRDRATTAGPAAMVDAMSRTLGDFSRELAESIRVIPKPKRPPVEPQSY